MIMVSVEGYEETRDLVTFQATRKKVMTPASEPKLTGQVLLVVSAALAGKEQRMAI